MVTPEYCLLVAHHWFPSTCMPRSDWASWVQAIGSIAGIVAAVCLVYVQLQHSRKSAQEADAGRLEARQVLLNLVMMSLKNLEAEHLTGQAHRESLIDQNLAQYEEARNALRGISLGSALNKIEAATLIDVRRRLGFIDPLVNTLTHFPMTPAELDSMTVELTAIAHHSDNLLREAARLRAL